MHQIIEGYMPFLGYQTYYRIVKGGKQTPLLLLHGGPGSTHNYFETLDRLADTGRDIIMYDQIGCGNSYLEGHPELWNLKTWTDELIALREYLHLDHVHLLGQSWGGMLALSYCIDQKADGVSSLILSSTLPSSDLWAHEQHRYISYMSEAEQNAISYAEKNNIWSESAYLEALNHFMILHAAHIDDTSPECVRRPKKSGTESYLTAWGENEFHPSGTLKDFNYIDKLHTITQPSLIISGTNDLCTPLIAKTMYDNIPASKWELFDGARHMCFVEQNDHYCEVLTKWMEEHH